MTSNVIVIQKTEHHYWPTCPCGVCTNKRNEETPSDPQVKRISPDAAFSLGIIQHKDSGSVASRLRDGILPNVPE